MHHCFRLTNPQTHHHHHPVPSFHTHTHTLKRTNSKGWRTFFFSRVTPDVPEPHIHTTTSPPRFSFSLFLLFCPSSSLIWSFCSCVFIDPPLSSHCFLYCFLQHLFFSPPPLLMHPPFHFAPLYSLCHSHPPLPHPIPDLFGCFVLLISSPFPPPASPFSSPSLYCKMQFHILYSLFFFSSISSKHLKEQ